ncbi:hypothetical protein JW710_02970 [Candidatus Dojkabacteria bacterium]|nr:hypothetical protein [Candidatus Dojkabacteria bacterium]
MKGKYIVIDDKGKEYRPSELLGSSSVNPDFKVFLEAEINGKKDPDRKSDYLRYAKKFGFDWEDNAEIGFMRSDYKANLMMELVKEYARKLVSEIGFPVFEVRGSNMFDMSYPVVRSYAGLFGGRLFKLKPGKKEMVMSYDASYPQFNLASRYQLSKNGLPFAHFSLSDCYRYEQSGECMLMYRLRRFFMPDLHPYFRDVEEAFRWYPKIEKKLIEAGRAVGREYQFLIEVASDKVWEEYKSQIKAVAKNFGRDVLIEIDQDKKDKYWIINADYKIVDKLGQSREICCIQIDVGNAKRLGIKYLDDDGDYKYPAIIHSAVPGGIERYLYMAIDGLPENFPLWLNPIQARVIPVSEKYFDSAVKLVRDLGPGVARIELDDRNESVSKRIKMAKEDLVPEIVVFGEKELSQKDPRVSLKPVLNRVARENSEKVFLNYSWPLRVSEQVRV